MDKWVGKRALESYTCWKLSIRNGLKWATVHSQAGAGLIESGTKWISENLFDGENFFHKRDPNHPNAFGAGIGCHIDQVFGQGWAHQLSLGRMLPQDKTVSALKSLWCYNFTPDVGPYRGQFRTGRWYAMPGEADLLMCTFPEGGEQESRGGRPGHGFAGYFNECINGFEYQAAGHMISEGLVQSPPGTS